jgi:quercetin dioxygenase-like cupin family protein
MKNHIQSKLLPGCLVILGALMLMLTVTLTGHAADSSNRTELKRVDLNGNPNMEVICSIVEFKPGDVAPRHFHHGVEAAYILQGAMIQEPGKEPHLLATGTNLINLRDVYHAGFKVVGDQTLRIYTVHIVDKGAPLYDPGK